MYKLSACSFLLAAQAIVSMYALRMHIHWLSSITSLKNPNPTLIKSRETSDTNLQRKKRLGAMLAPQKANYYINIGHHVSLTRCTTETTMRIFDKLAHRRIFHLFKASCFYNQSYREVNISRSSLLLCLERHDKMVSLLSNH